MKTLNTITAIESLPKIVEAMTSIKHQMDYETTVVHDLFVEYMTEHSYTIMEKIESITHVNGEILDKSFVGKLRYKLPKLGITTEDKYRMEKYSIHMAVLITQYLMDIDVLKHREELKVVVQDDGSKKFERLRYVFVSSDVKPKDLLYGLHYSEGVILNSSTKVKPGATPTKYNSNTKAFMRELSSMKFKRSDICTRELLNYGYSLSKQWNNTIAGVTKEDPILMKQRYAKYCDAILALEDGFYLSQWMDSRTRHYYDFTLEGMNPQGKLWETLMIDSYEPYIIDDNGYADLIHLIMVTLNGRMTMVEAMEQFDSSIIPTLHSIDLYSSKSLDALGENLLLKKLAVAYDCYHSSTPCHYLFGKDLTNSGVGIAGNSFRSSKMMHAGNYSAESYAVDSHTEFAAGYGLERNTIKSIHTGLLHGSTFKSMAEDLKKFIKVSKLDEYTGTHGLDGIDKLNADLEYLDASYVRDGAIKAYGHEVLNIDTIATWGGSVITNNHTSLRWKTMDGIMAQSTAYMEGVTLTLHVVSLHNKSGYATWHIVSDMPIVLTAKGELIYGTEDKVTIKKRGLYANITHSVDGALLRRVQRKVLSMGYVGLYKHDDYMLPLNAFSAICDEIRSFMVEVYETNPYTKALADIQSNHTSHIEVPKLTIGTASNTIVDSVNFLMP